MDAHDNFWQFKELVNKHLYFMPAGFNEGYDDKFTRYSQIFVILNMFLIDFFNKGVHEDNDTLSKLKMYESLFLNDEDKFRNLTEELEVINFLLALDVLQDLRR